MCHQLRLPSESRGLDAQVRLVAKEFSRQMQGFPGSLLKSFRMLVRLSVQHCRLASAFSGGSGLNFQSRDRNLKHGKVRAVFLEEKNQHLQSFTVFFHKLSCQISLWFCHAMPEQTGNLFECLDA